MTLNTSLNRFLLSPDPVDGGNGNANPSSTPSAVTPSTTTSTVTPSPAVKSASVVAKSPTDKDLTVNFDMPDDLGIEGDTQVELKSDTTKVEPTTKIEPKVVAKVEPTKVVEPIQPKNVKSRDYSGYSIEEAQVLKQMSNPAFEFTTKLMKQVKEQASKADVQYYQHPEAYTLSPDFRKIQEDHYYASQEAKYWERQLMAIKAGNKWTPLKGWKNGQPDFGTEQEPSAMAEEQIRIIMGEDMRVANQLQGKLGELKTSFANRVNQDLASIKSEQAKRFGWQADPKKLDEVIQTEGMGEQPVRKVKEAFSSLFSDYHKTSPLMDVASDLFVALQIYGAEIKVLKNQTQVAEIKQQEVIRGEPTSEVKAPADIGVKKSKFGIKTFDLEGLPS